jgi:hypothetical protein
LCGSFVLSSDINPEFGIGLIIGLTIDLNMHADYHRLATNLTIFDVVHAAIARVQQQDKGLAAIGTIDLSFLELHELLFL